MLGQPFLEEYCSSYRFHKAGVSDKNHLLTTRVQGIRLEAAITVAIPAVKATISRSTSVRSKKPLPDRLKEAHDN